VVDTAGEDFAEDFGGKFVYWANRLTGFVNHHAVDKEGRDWQRGPFAD
jgi:hypothetical protein